MDVQNNAKFSHDQHFNSTLPEHYAGKKVASKSEALNLLLSNPCTQVNTR